MFVTFMCALVISHESQAHVCRLMCKHCMRLDTMALIREAPEATSVQDLLKVCAPHHLRHMQDMCFAASCERGAALLVDNPISHMLVSKQSTPPRSTRRLCAALRRTPRCRSGAQRSGRWSR
jgi:hypothetical protein